MQEREAWDMLQGNNCSAKSLTDILDQMGVSKDSYMVVSRHGADLKIGDSYDAQGKLQANDYMTFGGSHYKDREFGVAGGGKQEIIRGNMNDFEAIDRQMNVYSSLNRDGKLVNGMTGSNNGVYAAMANMGSEMILTKDREIIAQLESQLSFASEQLGVPLSNGGVIMDPTRRDEWKMVEHRCEQISLGRMRGTVERPKIVPSPFKKETNSNTASHSKGFEM